jgi:hypothetical protein
MEGAEQPSRGAINSIIVLCCCSVQPDSNAQASPSRCHACQLWSLQYALFEAALSLNWCLASSHRVFTHSYAKHVVGSHLCKIEHCAGIMPAGWLADYSHMLHRWQLVMHGSCNMQLATGLGRHAAWPSRECRGACSAAPCDPNLVAQSFQRRERLLAAVTGIQRSQPPNAGALSSLKICEEADVDVGQAKTCFSSQERCCQHHVSITLCKL